MEYTVKKNKTTRIAYRTMGGVFIVIAFLALGFVCLSDVRYKVLVAAFAAVLLSYGCYLWKMSFRKQAYDITYRFEDAGMIVCHRKGEDKISYSDVLDVQVIVPDPSLAYRIMQIKVKGMQYVLYFNGNVKKCTEIYEYLDKRVERNDV